MLRSIFSWAIIITVAVLGIGLAALNTGPVTLSYHYGTWEMPLALLVGLCISVGAILGLAVSLIIVVKLKRQISGLRRYSERLASGTRRFGVIPLKKLA